MAIASSKANKKHIEALLVARELRQRKEQEGAQSLAARLQELALTIAMETGPNGRLFGSVGVPEVLAALLAHGIELEKKCLHLKHPIKELGQHAVSCKLHAAVQVELQVEVVSKNHIAQEAQDSAKEA